jgi:hypothetical protein
MITKSLTIGLVLLTLLASTFSYAQRPYQDGGIVQHVDSRQIHLPDRSYNLLATSKVILDNNKKGTLADVRPGQTVLLTIIRLDKKNLVDSIKILKP